MECDGTMKENKQKCQKMNMPVDKKNRGYQYKKHHKTQMKKMDMKKPRRLCSKEKKMGRERGKELDTTGEN